MTVRYEAEDIEVHLGLAGVRQNLAVYISDLDSEGIFKCVREPIVNSFDEFRNGHGKDVTVVIDKSGFWVCDRGRGFPVGIHPKTKISALTTAFLYLSAGGKMKKEGSSYGKATAGTHGMGLSVCTAASNELEVWTFRDRQWYTQRFSKGKEVSKLVKTSAPLVPVLNQKQISGTVIRFKPDYSLFDANSKIDIERLRAFLDLSSYTHAGLKIVLAVVGKPTVTFFQPKGLEAYLEKTVASAEGTPLSKPFYFQNEFVQVAMQWVNSDKERDNAFVNGTPTKEGGTHVNGLTKAVSEALAPFAGKRIKYRPEDLRAGLVYFLNAEVLTPKFTTQVKDKLRSPEAAAEVYSALAAPLKEFFSKNKTIAKEILRRAGAFAKADEDNAARRKGLAGVKGSKTKFGMPAKLLASRTKVPEERWLYLVEGDSVSGSTKKARDAYFQEVLPIQGKFLNVYGGTRGGKDFGKIYTNPGVISLLQAIGYDKDNPGKFRVGRIVVAGDADNDGLHISSLLFSFLHRLVPETYEQGMVYKLNGKLYSCQDNKGNRYYGDTLAELKINAGKSINENTITRFKGWGEANPEHLIDLMFGKEAKLEQVTAVSGAEEKEYIRLVGTDTDSVRAHCELIGVEGGSKVFRVGVDDDDRTSSAANDGALPVVSVFRFSRNFRRPSKSIRVR